MEVFTVTEGKNRKPRVEMKIIWNIGPLVLRELSDGPKGNIV